MRHSNRKKKQDRSSKLNSSVKDNHQSKTLQGELEIAEEHMVNSENYKLSWFKPTEKQKDIIVSMCTNECTIVQASSGCGKSTTAIFQGLQDIKRGLYSNGLVFIKTPSECGSDQIGYLKGDANQKLEVHFEAMRSIFYNFMSKPKLALEEKRGRITFTIPNFIQGKTFDNTLIILDEAQLIDVDTMKLILERLGVGSKIVVLGDKYQRYAAKKRNDGLTDLVEMVTEITVDGRESNQPFIGYVEMGSEDNMRSDFSKHIVGLYEDKFNS